MTTPNLDAWLGRSEACDDSLDLNHVERVALALDAAAPGQGEALPPLWQWCFFIKSVPYAETGADGHPARGGFLPPADNRNRMWAGGRVRFVAPLLAGVPARRTSTILKIQEKEGRTGKLLFVTVGHRYTQDGKLCVDEEQDIVYREPSPPKLQGTIDAPASQWSSETVPHSLMLFRYSAVTYNGHRIHYDYPYVTEVEGYPGLVAHGPLLATQMCRAFVEANPGKAPALLTYRGLRPLISPRPFKAAGRIDEDGKASLWVEQDGTLAHQAELEFKQ
ncbi:itaconyl-CoA hydratase [Pusillimonas sp. TS35]|nr:itaconyl-CoA hydratase [Pusillimonas sp. TS35]